MQIQRWEFDWYGEDFVYKMPGNSMVKKWVDFCQCSKVIRDVLEVGAALCTEAQWGNVRQWRKLIRTPTTNQPELKMFEKPKWQQQNDESR